MAATVSVGCLGLVGAYHLLMKYFEERRQNMPLNPFNVRSMTRATSFDWPTDDRFPSDTPITKNRIRDAQRELRLDVEHTTNIAVCGNSGTGKCVLQTSDGR